MLTSGAVDDGFAPDRVKEEFEDTKGVLRIRKSKNRQHNDQTKKDKQRSTKHLHKMKNRVTRTPLETRVNQRL